MTIIPDCGIAFDKPVETANKFIASRVHFQPFTVNGKQLFISCADDEAEQVTVHVAVPVRFAAIELAVERPMVKPYRLQVAFA